MKIEFLSYNTFAEHCGLIEAAQPHEIMGDEEMVAMEKLMSDALAAQYVERSEHEDTSDEISLLSALTDTDGSGSEESWEGIDDEDEGEAEEARGLLAQGFVEESAEDDWSETICVCSGCLSENL